MQNTFLTKKRKEDFAGVFAKVHLSMLCIEMQVLKFDRKFVDGQIIKQFIDEHNSFRKNNQRMFADLKQYGKTPNYQMLMPLYQHYLKEIEVLEEKLSRNYKKEPNFVKKTLFCYVHRLNAMNLAVYYAGTKSLNDLYSKPNGSADWEVLNYCTEELIYNSEQICTQNYQKISQLFKKFQISVYKSDNLLPGQEKEEFDKFLNTELDSMKTGGQFGKSLGELKCKVTLKFSKIFPEIVSSMLAKKSKIDEEFMQVMAAPNFEVLRTTTTLENSKKAQKIKKMFMDEHIKTNRMLNISIDAFAPILKEDVVSKLDEHSINNVRPFMAKDCGELTIDTKDLLPPALNIIPDDKLIQEHIPIRFLQ